MRYEHKKWENDPAILLANRRREILNEYRHNQLDPIKIAGEPISMELALYLGLLIDTTQQQADELKSESA
jgi:hypothetical protein